ncbi:MAG: MBL fold metallo-hydrolase [Promethearchaeota archaeon]|nr:MAG: MBL fold metallo-hydrolase [Candidatus Lokiarchaeota archaeon]
MEDKLSYEISEIEDVIQIKIDVPFDVKFVYVYLLKIKEEYILFDAGLNMGNWPKSFFAALKRIGVSPKNLSHCIISHNHMDHIGLIGKLRRKNPSIQIAMHDITNKKMKWETNPENFSKVKEETKKLTSQLIRYGLNEEQGKRIIRYFLTWPKMKKYYKPDIILENNDCLLIRNDKLNVIWTPGHALGHICIYEEKRGYLFSGDHILSRITPHIGIFIINDSIREKYKDFDFENILKFYLNSLEEIRKLNPKIIFPAHQEVIYDPIERINAIKKHHEKRLHEISDVIKGNPMTPYEISKIHFGELDEINSFLALSEVLAHLIYLESQGKVQRKEKNQKIFFIT